MFNVREHGVYSTALWTMIICNFVIPFTLLSIRKLRNITTICSSGVTVLIGMWLERFLIVIPTLSHPPLAVGLGRLRSELGRTVDYRRHVRGHALLYLLFVKAFPIIAIWEYEDDH